MTRKVFWEDPYLTELETRVFSNKGNDITVEETIFYAFSGGQESDSGTIGNRRVLEARKMDKDILYTMENNHGLRPGDKVRMEIDWERRYRLMRLHFAAEIVLEWVYQNVDAITKIGAHIAPDKARIDFLWGKNISTLFPSLQTKILEIVAADQDIISAFSDEEAEKRYWKIEGFAEVNCGGTHLRKTGEIGQILLKRKNPGKGKERIEIYLGSAQK